MMGFLTPVDHLEVILSTNKCVGRVGALVSHLYGLAPNYGLSPVGIPLGAYSIRPLVIICAVHFFKEFISPYNNC